MQEGKEEVGESGGGTKDKGELDRKGRSITSSGDWEHEGGRVYLGAVYCHCSKREKPGGEVEGKGGRRDVQGNLQERADT